MSTNVFPVRKRFGQHFLHDPRVVARIVDRFKPRNDDNIVEIGPGQGVLTRAILDRIDQTIDVIEIDRDLADALEADSRIAERLQVYRADILKFDFNDLVVVNTTDRQRQLRLIGNLPYKISTPLLFRMVEIQARVVDMLFMLQKEVVERIVSPPGTREYGRLGVMLSPWFDSAHVFDVGPGAFKPAPKVHSAIIHLTPRADGVLDVGDSSIYAELVRRAFSARRKTLRNAFKGFVEVDLLNACEIDPGLRPDTLSDVQFATIARRLSVMAQSESDHGKPSSDRD